MLESQRPEQSKIEWPEWRLRRDRRLIDRILVLPGHEFVIYTAQRRPAVDAAYVVCSFAIRQGKTQQKERFEIALDNGMVPPFIPLPLYNETLMFCMITETPVGTTRTIGTCQEGAVIKSSTVITHRGRTFTIKTPQKRQRSV